MCAAVGDNNAEDKKMSMKKAPQNSGDPVFIRAFMPAGYANVTEDAGT
jgi:hypothetical protein